MNIDKIISEAHLNAAEWNIENYQEGSSFFHCLSCYVFDLDRKRLVLLTLEEPMFYEIVHRSTYRSEEVAHDALKYLESYFKGKRSKSFLSDLAARITCYIGGSKSWQHAKNQVHNGSSDKPHLFLVVYKSKRNIHKRLIRPFISIDERRILPSGEVLNYIHQVVRMDAQNHPDWIK